MIFYAEFRPGAGLEHTAVVIIMTIGHVGARHGKTPMRQVVVDLPVQQKHRSEVRHRPVGMVELPYPIAITECPRGTEPRINTVLDLQNDFMPEVIQIARVRFLQVDIQICERICDLYVAQPF